MESLQIKSTLLHHSAPSNGQICCQLQKTCTNVRMISPAQSCCFSSSQHKQMISKNILLIQSFLKDVNRHGRFPRAVSAKINDRFLILAHGSNQVAETKLQPEYVEGHSESHSTDSVQRQDMKGSVPAKSVDTYTKGEVNEKTNALLEQLTPYPEVEPTVSHPILQLSHEFKLRSTCGPRLNQSGLGIVEFLKGKRILITGAIGFLAKVLLEKILREQPDVGQLYLLINADSTEKAKERLVTEPA